jgi:hypothetical protein
MNTRPVAVFAVLALSLLIPAGCSPSSAPYASTSLADLQYETRSYPGEIFHYSEILSLTGTMPLPDVGMVFHYPAGLSPTTAIGLSYTGSCCILDGETLDTPLHGETTDHARHVADIKDSIETIEALVEGAASLASRLLEVRSRISSLSKDAAASPPDSALRSVVEAAWLQLRDLHARSAEIQDKVSVELARLRQLTSEPGTLVARWDGRQTTQANGSAIAGLFSGDAGVAASDRGHGYIILSGLRVRHLLFGSDFESLMSDLADANQEFGAASDLAGITTSVLQARAVAFTNQRASNLSATLRSQLIAKDGLAQALSKDELASLAAMLDRTQEFASGGVIGRFCWTEHTLPAYRGTKDPGQRSTCVAEYLVQLHHAFMQSAARAQQTFDGQTNSVAAPPRVQTDDWKTVLVQITRAGEAAKWLHRVRAKPGSFEP